MTGPRSRLARSSMAEPGRRLRGWIIAALFIVSPLLLSSGGGGHNHPCLLDAGPAAAAHVAIVFEPVLHA